MSARCLLPKYIFKVQRHIKFAIFACTQSHRVVQNWWKNRAPARQSILIQLLNPCSCLAQKSRSWTFRQRRIYWDPFFFFFYSSPWKARSYKTVVSFFQEIQTIFSLPPHPCRNSAVSNREQVCCLAAFSTWMQPFLSSPPKAILCEEGLERKGRKGHHCWDMRRRERSKIKRRLSEQKY